MNYDYIIENYDKNKCFSSFLPGIAGKDGIPMWVFYVNRGQCIASFGIENNELAFTFEPRLSYEFYNDGEVEFKLFSKTLVKYINKNNSKNINKMEVFINNDKCEVKGNKLKCELAHKLRNKEIDKIICYFE